MNSFNKRYEFIKDYRFAIKNWKGLISEEKKGKPALLTRTCPPGLNAGKSGHDRSQSFGPISHASGPKLTF